MTAEQEAISELIGRYRMRIKNVYLHPNPYFKYPAWEKSEIEATIKRLEKLIK